MKKIFIVYGEESAHLIALNLIKQLQQIDRKIIIKGAGSSDLESENVEVILDLVRFSCVGIFEVLKNLNFFIKAFKKIVDFLKEFNPDCVILIDYPEFNLKLAKSIKRILNTKIIYYVPPQIWAWRKKRIKIIKKFVDLVLVIFKFEEEFYKKEGIKAEFVGYPRLEFIQPECDIDELKEIYRLKDKKPLIGIMPGSRKVEINYNLPNMLKTLKLLKKDFPTAGFILIKAENLDSKIFNRFINKFKDLKIEIIEREKYAAIRSCDFLIVCSGTATLETAILERPFVIWYRLNPLTYFILKKLVKIPFIGMPNILLREKVIPEFIQSETKPENVYRKVKEFLTNPNSIDSLLRKLSELKGILGDLKASQKAAQIILEEIS